MTVLNDRCTHSDGVRTKHPRLAPGGSREQAQRGIELLQERRTALISAAVTGKIDVRECERQGASRRFQDQSTTEVGA